MKESDIQRVILDYLQRVRHYFCWRNNIGAGQFFTRDGTARYASYGKKGSGDIIGLNHQGRFFSIEVKRPGENPKPHQIDFVNQVVSSGGIAIVAHSLEEVMNQGL